MKKLLLFSSLAILLCCYSCSKTDGVPPPSKAPLVTSPGVPDGAAVSKIITAAGGSITSVDGKIRVDIPAGALSSDQNITVQPITNKMEFGFGKAYRITPHITFNKPVNISFTYTEFEITHSLPELLGIAFQDSTGGWRAMGELQVDKNLKKITVASTHFSDWGFFPMIYIQPVDARVEPSKTLSLAVMGTVNPDDIIVPLPGGAPVTDPYPVPDVYLGNWSYSGEGSLVGKGSKADYTAPSQVPQNNPEAVSVEVKMKRSGYMLLVSNITVLSEFHIDYLQVDETDMNLPQLDYSSRLMIYGNFGNDPGEAKRSVKINGSSLPVMFWTPNLIVCEIYATGSLSAGNVEVKSGNLTDTKLLNEWIVDLKYEKVETPGGALTRKVNLVLRFRGDANGYIKAGQESILPYTDLNTMSQAVINMNAGTFSNNVSMETCGTYTVKWDALNDYQVDRIQYGTAHKGLGGRMIFTPEGIKLQIRFESPDVLKSTRIFDPCKGDRYTQEVMEPLSILGYEDEEIFLRFSGSGSGASILAGAMPELRATGVAPGMFFDITDLNPEAFFTNMKWAEVKPKYQ
jgi:hypothetical protein